MPQQVISARDCLQIRVEIRISEADGAEGVSAQDGGKIEGCGGEEIRIETQRHMWASR